MDGFKARVDGEMVASLGPKSKVVIIGEVLDEADMTLSLKAADGKKVTINFATPQGDLSKFIEVTGEVQDATTVTGFTSTNLGDKFDLGKYHEAIKLMDAIKTPFVTEG
eukprot:m.20843 g.20843  ORF g.20843 m.20843 type:complete len:109 (+) comp6283_c0_seq1:291-617(+)